MQQWESLAILYQLTELKELNLTSGGQDKTQPSNTEWGFSGNEPNFPFQELLVPLGEVISPDP